MRLCLYSIPVALYLFHTVLGGSVKFEGPDGTEGDVATCTKDNTDDKTLADLLEKEDLGFKRVGNNFFTDQHFLDATLLFYMGWQALAKIHELAV